MRWLGRHLKTLYWRAYQDNVTGLSAMVAYNLLLSLFPLAFLALFIAGRLLESSELEQSAIQDLQDIFPAATETTIATLLERVRNSATQFGIVALVASVWFCSSFWGALDTAFCRIYHVDCRSWVQQKRFALLMLVVVLLFIAATVAVPTAQSILFQGAGRLPFGLDDVAGVYYGITLVAGLVILFALLCLVYWTVPNRFVPWRAIWPGALLATIAIAAVDNAFPAYLGSISSFARFGTVATFVLILLVWFYAIALIILAGAEVNAARFEKHDTGAISGPGDEPAPAPQQELAK